MIARWNEEVRPCLRRIRMWQIPPHYSYHDWMDEMEAHCSAAALAAERHYAPEFGVPLSAFLHQRVMAAALSRYRQEWSYALRCVADVDADALPASLRDEFSEVVLREWLDSGLKGLNARDRWMVKRLYDDLCTEAEVASELRVTQQAVSKQKGVILRHLRGLLSEPSSGQPGYRRAAVGAGT